MRVYFRYALKETLSNLWRNRLMTIAAIMIPYLYSELREKNR